MNPELPDDTRDLMERLNRALPPDSGDVLDTGGDDQLVAVAKRLAQGPAATLPDAALDRIEARLRDRMASQAVSPSILQKAEPPAMMPVPPVPIRPSARRAARPLIRIAQVAAAACLVLILVVTGAVRASANSLPGDTLYPVKRAVENVRLTVASVVSDESVPRLRLDRAQRRINEFDTLLQRDEIYPRALEEASNDLNRALDLMASPDARQSTLNQRVEMLTQQQITLAEEAAPLASPQAQQRLQHVAQRGHTLQSRIESHEPDDSQETMPADSPLTPVVTESPAPVPAGPDNAGSKTSPTPSPLASVTPTPQPTSRKPVTPVPLDSDTGSPTPSPTGSSTPSRTPPGHGATPGMGNNPPGQDGTHPGQGNNGNPPGQDKSGKKK